MNKPELYSEDHAATYCPEDDKLRLYVGRVPREQYEALHAEGWTSTPKQDCDFVAVWTPDREDTALNYAGEIGDEDQDPADRAADRAERFAGYRDKRTAEAFGHADRYEAGPAAHGYQSQARAERAAARHDRIAGRAVTQWDKADYWTERTAGVIAHALHVSSPGVRMGRIKTLEAELRKAEKAMEDRARIYRNFQKLAAIEDPERQTAAVLAYAGGESLGYWDFQHPRDPERKSSLYSLLSTSRDPITGAEACALYFKHAAPPADDTRHTRHLKLRLAYENQMLEAQGGRAASLDMEPGGTFKGGVIAKVNKSPATGRVVSVAVIVPAVSGWQYKVTNEPGTPYALAQLETERAAPGDYQPPTGESRAKLDEFNAARKAAADARKAKAPPCPLVNPTDEDAERLQALFNSRITVPAYEKDHKPSEILRMTQAEYSANSKGSYSAAETHELCAMADPVDGGFNARVKRARQGPPVCKVRLASGGGYHNAKRVIVITDKPRKPLPAELWEPYACPDNQESLIPHAAELAAIVRGGWEAQRPAEAQALIFRAQVAGLLSSGNYNGWTEAGIEWSKKHAPAPVTA